MSEAGRGVAMGVGAYLLWGMLPLYWRLFRSTPPLELLAHRIVWSLVFLGLLLAAGRSVGKLRSLDRRKLRLLVGAALVVGVNWGLFIWGVTRGHVVETALGYFINPLLTVMLGVVALRERLRRLQWGAVAIAGGAVVVLTIAHGRLPWLALALASTFATYGLLKKRAAVDAVLGLAIETAVLVLPAIALVVWRGSTGEGAFGRDGSITMLLLSSGVVTAVPLLLFGGAANRTPLRVLGPLQYISPTLQFFLGLFVFHESMPPARWVGFALVWLALAIFLLDGLIRSPRERRAATLR